MFSKFANCNRVAKIRRDPGSRFVVTKNTKVCSEHFTFDDFVILPGCPSIRSTLKPSAIPSVFAWSKATHNRETVTSRKAFCAVQRKDFQNDSLQCLDEYESDKCTSENEYSDVDGGMGKTL